MPFKNRGQFKEGHPEIKKRPGMVLSELGQPEFEIRPE
jgi:hypothetical protein